MLQIVAGGLQTGTVGEELSSPLVVRVTDSEGRPVQGQLVNFHVVAGNGSVYARAASTNSDGVAQERWTLGTVAGYTQRDARAVDSGTGEAILFATFKAVAEPGPASALTSVGGAALSGGTGIALAESLTVKLSRPVRQPVPDQTVVFAVTSGGGTVSPTERITGATGVARTVWTLGTNLNESQTATASLSSLPPVTFTATAAAAGTLTRLQGDGQTCPVGVLLPPDSLAVRLTAAAGTPVRGATVSWSGAGMASPPTSLTDADGVVKTSWTLGRTSGPQQLSAQVSGTTITASFSANAQAAAPDTIHFVSYSPNRREIGRIETVTVRVVDLLGNSVPEQTVYWETICGGPVSPTSSVTDTQGLAKTGWQVSSCDSGEASIRVYIPDVAQRVLGMIDLVQTSQTVDLTPDSVAATTDTGSVRLRIYLYDGDGQHIQPYEGCRHTCYAAFDWTSTNEEVVEFVSFPDTDTQAEADFRIKAAGVARIIVSNGVIADTSVVVVATAPSGSQAVLRVNGAPGGGASSSAGTRPLGVRRPEE